VVGAHFYPLHLLFESQYQEMAKAIDLLAERIRGLGHAAPATFSAFQKLTRFHDGPSVQGAQQMLTALLKDHTTLIAALREGIENLGSGQDEGTVDMLVQRLQAHEKMAWMLTSSRQKDR
jgi:starvation-inducible DNA-binding protein